jgi:protease-4
MNPASPGRAAGPAAVFVAIPLAVAGRLLLARRLVLAGALLAAGASAPALGSSGEPFPPYSSGSNVIATTPSTDDGALGALFNPAQWGVLERPEASFFWSDQNYQPNKMDNWGFAVGRGLGFTLRYTDGPTASAPVASVTDYQVGIGGGSGSHFSGLAFGFSGPGKGAYGRESYLAAGEIFRPSRRVDVGLAGRFAPEGGDLDGMLDVGIRPLGDPRLLLFGDYAIGSGDRWDDGSLEGGLAIEPVPGIMAAGRWSEDARFQLTVGVTLRRSGFRAAPRYSDGDLGSTSYVVRLDPPVRGVDIAARRRRGRHFLEMDLKGRVVYQPYRFGDKNSMSLLGLLAQLQFAEKDPAVGGVAINLSGFEANPTMAWEIREKLLELRQRGKKVVVYCDNLDLTRYYLASAADRILMDPLGLMVVPGVQLSRTYLAGLLAKLGLGFEEWRYYRYKSALEALSRTDMSPADREQFQDLVDAAYGAYAAGVTASGRITRAEFDSVVNAEPLLTAPRLLQLRWIDQVGTAQDLRAAARAIGDPRADLVGYRALSRRRWQPDETWGPVPTIALVYAVGPCAMDTGIKARETSKQLREYRRSGTVDAVVMRVDSPGGEALASDLVAREMRAYAAADKPLYVSQGRVAASGGYWISMDADSISTTPFTVTGSIGVIGGWIWDDGFSAKTGLTSDHVQVGKSADLLGGIRIPLVGATLPERNLTESEQSLVQRNFAAIYDDFTGRVASARGLDVARVREIAEGRVYMGPDAVTLKLVDRVATLDETIEAAKRAAGVEPGRRVRIVEYPKPGFLKLPGILSALGGGGAETAPASPLGYDGLVTQQIVDNPGQPLLLAPGPWLPAEAEAR